MSIPKSKRDLRQNRIYEKKGNQYTQGSFFRHSNDFPTNAHKSLDIIRKPSSINYAAVEKLKEDIYYKDMFISSLPINLHELLPAIEKSKYILELPSNWDGEGAEAYTLAVWRKAILFLIKYATWVFKLHRKIIAIPSIYHAPNGSIDIYWETSTFNMLLNVSDKDYATYYGDDYAKDKNEGELNIDNTTFRLFPILV